MRNHALSALVLSALLLSGCGSTTPTPSPVVTTPPVTTPESAATPESVVATAALAAATTAPEPAAAVQWVLDPTIEADTIDVLPLLRGSANQQDYNAFSMHKDDGLCLIVQGGRQGLIDYNGNLVAPARCPTPGTRPRALSTAG